MRPRDPPPPPWTVPASGCTCDGSLATAESRGPAHAPAAVGRGEGGTHTPNKPALSVDVTSISTFEFEASALKRCFTPETDEHAKLSRRFEGRSAHTRTTLEVKTLLPKALGSKPSEAFRGACRRLLGMVWGCNPGLRNDAPQEPPHLTALPDSTPPHDSCWATEQRTSTVAST